jgi:hypothetical protein
MIEYFLWDTALYIIQIFIHLDMIKLKLKLVRVSMKCIVDPLLNIFFFVYQVICVMLIIFITICTLYGVYFTVNVC